MALTPGTRFGPYAITAQIGVGRIGEVYWARDTKLDRDVAMKVLPASLAGDPACPSNINVTGVSASHAT